MINLRLLMVRICIIVMGAFVVCWVILAVILMWYIAMTLLNL